MPMSETLRKQNLFAEIAILVTSLNERTTAGIILQIPSQEEVDKMSMTELEAMKRDYAFIARSLGGISSR